MKSSSDYDSSKIPTAKSTYHTTVPGPDNLVSFVPVAGTGLSQVQLSDVSSLHVVPEGQVAVVVVPIFRDQPW